MSQEVSNGQETRVQAVQRAESKREALKRASEDGMTDKVVCDELGISIFIILM